MAEPHLDRIPETPRRKGAGRRPAANASVESSSSEAAPSQSAVSAPCGACKFLRRKCVSGCIFAPHFASDQGAAKFAAVHKVFGASNVSKLLTHIPVHRRQDAVVTISYEAQARLSDPVYGCVSTILALQQQVASLQAELAVVQSQLVNSRFAMANVLHSTQQNHQQDHQQLHQMANMLQPAYSNNSTASTNLINMSNFASNFDLVADTAPSSHSLGGPLHLSRSYLEDDDDEEESKIPAVFADEILHRR